MSEQVAYKSYECIRSRQIWKSGSPDCRNKFLRSTMLFCGINDLFVEEDTLGHPGKLKSSHRSREI